MMPWRWILAGALILGAYVALAVAAGMEDRPVRFEDGSWSDGSCDRGAVCDDVRLIPATVCTVVDGCVTR